MLRHRSAAQHRTWICNYKHRVLCGEVPRVAGLCRPLIITRGRWIVLTRVVRRCVSVSGLLVAGIAAGLSLSAQGAAAVTAGSSDCSPTAVALGAIWVDAWTSVNIDSPTSENSAAPPLPICGERPTVRPPIVDIDAPDQLG